MPFPAKVRKLGQILAEAFKRNGYGGIAYRSSYGRSSKDDSQKGYNVVLFNVDDADLINCGLYDVRDVSIDLSQADNPYFVSKYYPQTNQAPPTAATRKISVKGAQRRKRPSSSAKATA